MSAILELQQVAKSFTMHLQDGLHLPIVNGVSFSVAPGECVVLSGPSGAGKSSILKMIYGTYRCDSGRIAVNHNGTAAEVTSAQPRDMLWLRRNVISYVSQFLRAIPRVAAIDIVAQSVNPDDDNHAAARAILTRLNIPERLWSVPPATFSGGEQQRINIARGFLQTMPLLLLDEPTASLDEKNSAVVIDLIAQKKQSGSAIVAVVHDAHIRDAIADRVIDMSQFAVA
jgi:alpha-D-ribose 1-methylphosphonate 5-triphosphate synthase subunit PhnL